MDKKSFLQTESNLQSVRPSLVESADLGRNAEVDCALANLDDEASNDVGVDLGRLAELTLCMHTG